MRISRLKLTNFKKFSDLTIDFDKDLNVIIGNNETGKSTVAEAILEGLYADPTSSAKGIKKFFPWNKDGSKTIIEMDIEDKNILYYLKKDFGQRTVEFTNLDTNKTTSNLSDVEEIIRTLLGIPGRKAYLSTAFIRQSDVVGIEADDSDFINALQSVASANRDVNIQTINSGLEDEIRRLKVGIDRPATNPGLIRRTMDELSALKNEFAQKKEQYSKTSLAFITSEQSKKGLTELNEKIKRLEKLLTDYKTYTDAIRTITQVDEQLLAIQSKVSTLDQYELKRQSFLKEMSMYKSFNSNDLDNVIRNLIAIREEQKILNSQLEEFSKVDLESPKQTKNTNPENSKLGIITLLLSIVAALILFAVTGNIIAGIFGAVIPAFIFLMYLLFKNQNTQVKSNNVNDEVLAKKQNINLRLNVLSVNQNSIFQSFNCTSLADFYTQKARFVTLKETLSELEAEMKGIVGNQSSIQIKEAQLKLLAQKKEVETNQLTEEVKLANLSKDEYFFNIRELDKLKMQKTTLEKELTASTVRIEDAEVSIDDINLLEEKIAYQTENYASFNNQLNVLNLTLEGIKEAIKETAQNANELVSKEIEKYLEQLTKNRYKNARLTDKLNIEIFSNESNSWINPKEVLSNGTVDQIYFLARIAFLKILVQDKTIPLILDDPFIACDFERRSEIRKILDDLVTQYQIILLTYDEGYVAWGNPIRLR